MTVIAKVSVTKQQSLYKCFFSQQACVCSAYIPVYCGLIPPTLQGVVRKFAIVQHVCTFLMLSSVSYI